MKPVYLPSVFTAVISLLWPALSLAGTEYNPQISLILDGRYSDYSENPEDYSLPGFQPGAEAGLAAAGFSVGHSEIILSANIDHYFSAQATFAIGEHEGETEVGIEEAFIQTTALGHGAVIKFGRFFSSFGYLNEHHEHSWDFADAPLMYRALFGNTLRDDGVQLNYVLPTDMLIELSAELFSGNAFPAAGNEDGGIGAGTLSLTLGDDIGDSHAWQLGVSRWQANAINGRTSAANDHGGIAEIPSFDGESEIDAVDFVYKWAPQGSTRERAFKLQMEYFQRSELGDISMVGSGPLESSTYHGEQQGGYVQAIYQFMPRWRTGVRFDQLEADNRGGNEAILGEAGLLTDGYKPERKSVMVEWLPSEFSRLRLQFNRDQSSAELTDKQIFLQYTHSLGAHGAHSF